MKISHAVKAMQLGEKQKGSSQHGEFNSHVVSMTVAASLLRQYA
jgi:hypothetical protein